MRHALLAASVMAGLFLTACGPSSYDLYIEGLKIAGDAERRECQLVFDKGAKAHVLNTERISRCLAANKLALEKFEEARAAGHEGRDFELTIEDTKMRIDRLESMMRMVSRIERQQVTGE